jgi:hypothetical protein
MFHVGTCTQCLKHELALSVVMIVNAREHGYLNLYFSCPNCKMPSCAQAFNYSGHSPKALIDSNNSADNLRLDIQGLWPSAPKPNLPEFIPDQVKNALIQAESNFAHKHNEAAAVMYRKSLELGLKAIDPALTGMLASRIKQLGDTGKLTSDLVSWAHEIRTLGNDGAHDEESMDRSQLESLRGLTEMVLKHLFTLPKMVEQRRNLSKKAVKK